MQISREELLPIDKNKRIDALDILILLWSFSDAFLHSVLYVLNRQSISGQLAMVYIIVAIGAGLLFFRYANRKLPMQAVYVFLIFFFMAISFLATRFKYGTTESGFVSEFRACYAMIICSYMLAMLIVWSGKREINLNWILLVATSLTIVSFLALTRGDSLTTGGYIRDSSGFLYQNISYYSAYALGLTVFHAIETKRRELITPIYKGVYLVLLLIQLFSCFLSGGRGGAVLAIALVLYGIIILFGIRNIYKMILPATLLAVAAVVVFPRIISSFGVNIKGLTRVLSIFSRGATDTGRSYMFGQAMDVFNSKPIFGDGIGSIFYHLHSYSHNMFSDILAETGAVGALTVIGILVAFIIKAKSIYEYGSVYRLLIIIFICGIVLNLFSGYIWVNQHVWFPVAVILMLPKKGLLEE